MITVVVGQVGVGELALQKPVVGKEVFHLMVVKMQQRVLAYDEASLPGCCRQ